MALAMSRPHRYPKTGVYWLRKRVLRGVVAAAGRQIEYSSLGTKSPEEAKRRLAAALGELEARWANVRGDARSLSEREAHELAAPLYAWWVGQHCDEPSRQTFWRVDVGDRLWPKRGAGWSRQPDLAAALVREAEDEAGSGFTEMEEWCFDQADALAKGRGLRLADGDRRKLAAAIAAVMQRASLRLAAASRGEPLDDAAVGFAPPAPPPAGTTAAPASPGVRADGPRVSLTELLVTWWVEAKAAGRKPSTFESYRNTMTAFVAFLGHDDAARGTGDHVVAFKGHRLSTPSKRTGKVPSAKTVKDSDLSALKTLFGWTLFGWAVTNRKLGANPAVGITIKVGKAPRLRSKGFTDTEASAILAAARDFWPGQEAPKTAAAKRWVPWLCGFTGGRVGELAQLRREDVTQRNGHWVVRITPEAGTVKTNEAREVVLHRQVVDQGFPAFVASAPAGHLFLTLAKSGDVLGPLQGLKNRLAEFSRAVVPDPGVAPNHGWRHRFKTVGMDAGVELRVLDAIQGHVARSVADNYGDVTLKTIAQAIDKFPSIEIRHSFSNRVC